MKEYTGAMLHGCMKTDPDNVERSSLDLGMIPEEVMKSYVNPTIQRLNVILNPYSVYLWTTMGYVENKSTENEL